MWIFKESPCCTPFLSPVSFKSFQVISSCYSFFSERITVFCYLFFHLPSLNKISFLWCTWMMVQVLWCWHFFSCFRLFTCFFFHLSFYQSFLFTHPKHSLSRTLPSVKKSSNIFCPLLVVHSAQQVMWHWFVKKKKKKDVGSSVTYCDSF